MAERGKREEDSTGRDRGGGQPGSGERKKKEQKDGLGRGRGKSQGDQAALWDSLPCSLAHSHPHAGLRRGQGPSLLPKRPVGGPGLGRVSSLMCGWHRGLTSHYLLGLRPPLLSPLSPWAIMVPTSRGGGYEDWGRHGAQCRAETRQAAAWSASVTLTPSLGDGRQDHDPHFMGEQSSGVAGMGPGGGGAERALDKMSENQAFTPLSVPLA